jgi:deazaflavin-dependent oxidoreductase (nitroreductase family)
MNIWIRSLMSTNVFLYRLTGGRLGGKMGGQNVLLLHTIGRKSGKTYITPTNYYRDGENYVLVASNWGEASHPSWYFNLLHQPSTHIQVLDQLIQVQAHPASGEEYARLWSYVTGKNAFYVRYQQKTKRQIPLIILTPHS